ncbi:Hypothetical protein ZAZAV_215, partial [Cedratvirus Zaza IHUMI]
LEENVLERNLTREVLAVVREHLVPSSNGDLCAIRSLNYTQGKVGTKRSQEQVRRFVSLVPNVLKRGVYNLGLFSPKSANYPQEQLDTNCSWRQGWLSHRRLLKNIFSKQGVLQ